MVQRRGYVSIDALSAHFKVTPQTIRHDINTLSARKLLVRQHGGASLSSSVFNTDYSLRKIELLEEKEAIARTLKERSGMKVVTNNPEAARILAGSTDFEILLAGGLVQRHNGGIVGPTAVEFVSRFKCDYLVTSVGAVDADGSLLDFKAYAAKHEVQIVFSA